MNEWTVRLRFAVVGLLGIALVGVWWPLPSATATSEPVLEVHFLDVGQGDAILIEAPDGTTTLIDGGPDTSVLRALGEELPFFTRTIDLVVATHFDADHIGGLVDVFTRYQVPQLLTIETEHDTTITRRFKEVVSEQQPTVTYARRGQVFSLGEGVYLEILSPASDTTKIESNTASIVAKLIYGDISFLLTGDAPKGIEEYLTVAFGEHLQSTVLKAGHHGSRTSTAEDFVAEVAPQYAVISAAADNRYGHPHVEVTDTLFNYGVTILETAKQGTISFATDGQHLWLTK